MITTAIIQLRPTTTRNTKKASMSTSQFPFFPLRNKERKRRGGLTTFSFWLASLFFPGVSPPLLFPPNQPTNQASRQPPAAEGKKEGEGGSWFADAWPWVGEQSACEVHYSREGLSTLSPTKPTQIVHFYFRLGSISLLKTKEKK